MSNYILVLTFTVIYLRMSVQQCFSLQESSIDEKDHVHAKHLNF